MDKRAILIAELQANRARGGPIGLAKSTSNLFRHRDGRGAAKIDVRNFNRVLTVDRNCLVADVEGMTTYADFVDETLNCGLLPTVVPQLKSITVGGAVSGLGIESSSFRFGLVHETVVEMDILLGDGSIVTCSRSQHEDLFYGFPNSYGTLGYVLRLRVMLVPARPYVHLVHEKFHEPASYFDRIAELCAAGRLDYLDGVVFGRDEMYVTTGEFTEEAPRLSDYTYLRIYYKSIREKTEDWLTAKHYIWRWDTDWFWCSKHFGVQNPTIRLLATKWALNSVTYQRIMRLSRLLPAGGTESVIQDVDIPIEKAEEFLDFLLRDIGITPVWICPFKAFDPTVTFDLYALDPKKVYVNFGFWDMVPAAHEHGFFNRLVERKAMDLGGKKGLYSTVYYDEETFWKIYNKERYFALKQKYDPGGVFQDLYKKCVTG
ncbi:MAG TPA: FAD-binding oxidoreductase [Bryobacteraceae bacterium]|nr:FAD-binding oxidoreductase [Bryobacteraceae bacterium]